MGENGHGPRPGPHSTLAFRRLTDCLLPSAGYLSQQPMPASADLRNDTLVLRCDTPLGSNCDRPVGVSGVNCEFIAVSNPLQAFGDFQMVANGRLLTLQITYGTACSESKSV
ncbi:serine/threonine-protein kinase 24 [Anopheles sinensis]|uniref:Serine/threonine-protein kinase 24 n=1 Tax=Anopheles sinensis TaxID=74873 RepID=A0A084VHI7_ANOSI|nr:serine/threonine-protein kinase 24 [Anopheles sinensis]